MNLSNGGVGFGVILGGVRGGVRGASRASNTGTKGGDTGFKGGDGFQRPRSKDDAARAARASFAVDQASADASVRGVGVRVDESL